MIKLKVANQIIDTQKMTTIQRKERVSLLLQMKVEDKQHGLNQMMMTVKTSMESKLTSEAE